jgi:SAM-dependent methyltransferase
LARFARQQAVGSLAREHGRASEMLYERLADDDVAAVEERIRDAPELRALYDATSNEAARHHLILTFGIWLGVQCVPEKTGLSIAQPTDEIHAMARGPMAAAGGLYEADMVVDALASCSVEMGQVREALDFGCSSARVVRVLGAAYPETRWHGCDPNSPAIEWAAGNLPGIDFFRSGDAPPLPLPDGSLDLAYAISIWSHFAPDLGLRWFDEMYRLIRPGGHLVFTTHGPTSIAFYATRELRTPQQSDEIVGELYRQGWWYAPEFGKQGDWGVVNPEWGTAFLSPEWVLAELCPRWQVLEFAPGRNQENQDVYVLRRV